MRGRNFFSIMAALFFCFIAYRAVSPVFEDFQAGSPVERYELLRAPGFDDVSAFNDSDIKQVDAWLQEQVALTQYPSLSVAIVHNGKISYQGAFGFEDIETHKKATVETPYNVASVTKVFTALLAVMLHANGVINLDHPASMYLPEDVSISAKPEIGATITLRQLASHTSGLPRGVPGQVQSVDDRYQLEPKLLYDHLTNVTLAFDPGTDELYSNLGMGLLGHVLELASGKPYDRLLQEMVCDPLQLEQTAIQVNDKLRPATGYGSTIPRRADTHSLLERLAPSGGLISSAPDLAKFLSAQMKPGLLTSGMLEQLHTATILSDGSAAGTALGWSVRSRDSTGRILKKNGGRNNCSAWIGFAPDHGVGVAVVTNCGEPSVDPIGYWLLERSIPGVPSNLLDRKPVIQYEYAKVAPYTDVGWTNDKPIVRVQGRWSPLVSVDGIPIERIMAFAEQEFGDIARKRFAEDLVELLSVMGHEPGWDVTLGLEKHDGQVEHVKIRMTKENRNLVRQ